MSKKFDRDHVTLKKDDIQSMSDDHLMANIRRYRRMIKEARYRSQDSMRFEIEFCYLDHERQMREKYSNYNFSKVSNGR